MTAAGNAVDDEEEGFIETVTCLMAVKSFREKRPVRWDPVKQQIV